MTIYMGQIMAECDCTHPACEQRGYCMAARIEELEAERDEALNQLDSARHSIDVLERRVAELKNTES